MLLDITVSYQVRYITCHEGTDGECRYISILSLTSALDGVGVQRHTVATYPRE
jgi:hypothetical protein